MRVLVAGGAGYIGSVVTAALLAGGHEVTVLDDLSTGHADAVPEGARLAAVSLHDSGPVLADVRPEAVLHFAAKSLVGCLPAAARGVLAHQRRRIARAARGDAGSALPPDRLLVDGRHLRGAGVGADPGGRPDPADQHLRRDQARRRPDAHVLRGGPRLRGGEPAVLQRGRGGVRARRAARDGDPPDPDRAAGRGRAAGVDDRLRRGLPDARRHLHPRLRPRRPTSPTRTCWPCPPRRPGEHRIYNLGNGTGFSVQQVVDAVREVTGHPVPVVVGARRAGDPAQLVASSDRSAPTWAGRRSTPSCPGSCATPGTWRPQGPPRASSGRGRQLAGAPLRCSSASAGSPVAGPTRSREIRRPSSSSTSMVRPSTSIVSPTSGSRPSSART